MRSAIVILISALALGALVAAPVSAQYYTATLDGAQETPPVNTPATGFACLYLDENNMLSFNISYSGLLGVETAAHIHCCAPAGTPAGVLFPLPAGNPKVGVVGPLTPAQVTSLNSSLMYVNIHTNLYTGGEIRGQIIPAGASCEPVPTESSTWGAIKALYR